MEYHSVPCFEWSFERVGSRALDGILYIDSSLGIEVFVENSKVIHYICSGGVEYQAYFARSNYYSDFGDCI